MFWCLFDGDVAVWVNKQRLMCHLMLSQLILNPIIVPRLLDRIQAEHKDESVHWKSLHHPVTGSKYASHPENVLAVFVFMTDWAFFWTLSDLDK